MAMFIESWDTAPATYGLFFIHEKEGGGGKWVGRVVPLHGVPTPDDFLAGFGDRRGLELTLRVDDKADHRLKNWWVIEWSLSGPSPTATLNVPGYGEVHAMVSEIVVVCDEADITREPIEQEND